VRSFFNLSLWIFTMNRCVSIPLRAPQALSANSKPRALATLVLGTWLATLWLVLLRPSWAVASQEQLPERIPPISRLAKFGVLVITQPPEALLDGRPARLSPGARIRGVNNMLVLSGTLVGLELQVLYTREKPGLVHEGLMSEGLVHEVWVLSPQEMRKLLENPR
jgi:hypothetical protein